MFFRQKSKGVFQSNHLFVIFLLFISFLGFCFFYFLYRLENSFRFLTFKHFSGIKISEKFIISLLSWQDVKVIPMPGQIVATTSVTPRCLAICTPNGPLNPEGFSNFPTGAGSFPMLRRILAINGLDSLERILRFMLPKILVRTPFFTNYCFAIPTSSIFSNGGQFPTPM